MTHLKQSCWAQHWPVHVVDNYRSFWAFWWASVSRCDSESYPPHTLRICHPVCKSRPPCRSLHAVWGGKSKVDQMREKTAALDFYTDRDYSTGKMMPWENIAFIWFWSLMMMMHIGNTHRHNRSVAKTQNSSPTTKKKVSTLCPRLILRENYVCVNVCARLQSCTALTSQLFIWVIKYPIFVIKTCSVGKCFPNSTPCLLIINYSLV